MRKIVLLVGCFIVSLLVFLIALMPARVALSVAQKYQPQGLELGPASGTVWRGRIDALRYQRHFVSGLNWEISPLALVGGQLNAKVVFGEARKTEEFSGYGSVSFDLLSRQVSLENTKLRAQLASVMQELRLPVPVEASGRLFLELAHYQSGDPYCSELRGEIGSPDVRVRGLNGQFSIGELTAALGCKSGELSLKTDGENLLGLAVDASLAGDNRFSASGYIKPDASLPKEVHDAVKFIGRPDAEGRYQIKL